MNLLWHQPARELPVTLRPFGAETLPSYARRLAAANDLPATAILRALGDLSPNSSRYLFGMEGVPNRAAQQRLQTLTGISRSQLVQALPSLTSHHHRPLPTDRPAIYFRRLGPGSAGPACTECVRRRAATAVTVRLSLTTQVCRPHRRWIGHHQHNLSDLPVVLAAFNRHRRLRAQHEAEDPAWFDQIHWTAVSIAWDWLLGPADRHPNLQHRWNLRAERLDTDVRHAFTLITLPEVVTLAELLSDLTWRKKLAMTLTTAGHRKFYHLVAQRTGATERSLIRYRLDALHRWVISHHERFESTRLGFLRDHYGIDRNAHSPEIGHFK